MQNIKKLLKNIIKKYHISQKIFVLYAIIFALIGYFSVNAIIGPKGFLKLNNLKEQIANKDTKLKALTAKIENRQLMIKSISLESLDTDLLDEESRKILGYIGKNEIIIYE